MVTAVDRASKYHLPLLVHGRQVHLTGGGLELVEVASNLALLPRDSQQSKQRRFGATMMRHHRIFSSCAVEEFLRPYPAVQRVCTVVQPNRSRQQRCAAPGCAGMREEERGHVREREKREMRERGGDDDDHEDGAERKPVCRPSCGLLEFSETNHDYTR